MKYLFIIFISSILFPLNFSRMVTTFDSSGEYSFIFTNAENQQNNEFTFNTEPGINIAYEHMITDGGVTDGIDFYLFGGGEFMFGRRSDVNVSFHSVYIKPIIALTDKFMITFRGGITNLNTEQKDFLLDWGSILSMGFEYHVTDNLSLVVSRSYYNLFKDSYSSQQSFLTSSMLGNSIGNEVDLQSTNLDMKYIKTGISVVYGLKNKTKRTK